MVHIHKYNIDDVYNMYVFERDIFVKKITEYIEEQEKATKEAEYRRT